MATLLSTPRETRESQNDYNELLKEFRNMALEIFGNPDRRRELRERIQKGIDGMKIPAVLNVYSLLANLSDSRSTVLQNTHAKKQSLKSSIST